MLFIEHKSIVLLSEEWHIINNPNHDVWDFGNYPRKLLSPNSSYERWESISHVVAHFDRVASVRARDDN